MRIISKVLDVTTARERRRYMLCAAIRQLKKAEIFYHGGSRTVEPYCLGIVKKGDADNESLICWQTAGFSELGEGKGWKLYRVSEMEEIQVLRESFDGSRPGFDPDDVDMARIICYARPAVKPVLAVKAPDAIQVIIPPPVIVPIPSTLTPSPSPLSHNERMLRFRRSHPLPLPAPSAKVSPGPLGKRFPERIELKLKPVAGSTGEMIFAGRLK